METREYLYDVRVVDRHLQRRILKRDELDKVLKALPDTTGRFEICPLGQQAFVEHRAEQRAERERLREFSGDHHNDMHYALPSGDKKPVRMRRAKLANAALEGEEAEVFAEQTRGSGLDSSDLAELHITGESRSRGSAGDE